MNVFTLNAIKTVAHGKVENLIAQTSHNDFNRTGNCTNTENASEELQNTYFNKVASDSVRQGHSFGVCDSKSAIVLLNKNHARENLSAQPINAIDIFVDSQAKQVK